MTDDELRVRLATALGWRPLEVAGQWHITREYGAKSEVMPSWPTSLDACMRDLLPPCRELGYRDWMTTTTDDGRYGAVLAESEGNAVVQHADTIARAFAEACLSCLEAGE